jgi:hypothetical protein
MVKLLHLNTICLTSEQLRNLKSETVYQWEINNFIYKS